MPEQGKQPSAPDLLVIGLGATGTIALDAATREGVNAIGVDCKSARGSERIDGCQYNTRVWGIFSDGTVAWSTDGASHLIAPKMVVIATGAIDLPLPLPGWQLPGVVGAHRASRLLEDGANVVVLRGPHAELGNRVPDLSRFNILTDVDLAGGDPIVIAGTQAVEAIRIGDTQIATRRVLLDNGLQPENMLARMAGLPSLFSADAGGDVIETGSVIAASQGTLLSVVGDAAGISGDEDVTTIAARETGRLLADAIHGGPIPVSIPKGRPAWRPGGTPTLPRQTTDGTLVCPDENVTVGMVRDAIARGATTVNDVKRRTRAAMAVCQGRDCLWTIRALLAESGRSVTTPMTARAPITDLTLGELASLRNRE